MPWYIMAAYYVNIAIILVSGFASILCDEHDTKVDVVEITNRFVLCVLNVMVFMLAVKVYG